MKHKKIIFLIILFILSVLVIYYMYSKNKIKTLFSIENIKIEQDEKYKKRYLNYGKESFSINYFRNMPMLEKERFYNFPDEYDCYELSMTAKNESKYNAIADLVTYKNNINDVWIDEYIGIMAPYNVKANSTRELSTCIICKKGVLENLGDENIKFELRLFINDCPLINEIRLSN